MFYDKTATMVSTFVILSKDENDFGSAIAIKLHLVQCISPLLPPAQCLG